MKKFKRFKRTPTHMDYEGQKLAERLFHIIILCFGTVGFLWGYYIQQFGATIIILAAGFIVSCVDYEGQKLAERLFHIIILFFGTVGFLWGYYIQQFGATIIILAAGFIVSCVLVLPPWPMYRKHPLDWQKPRQEKVDTKREGGKKKQK